MCVAYWILKKNVMTVSTEGQYKTLFQYKTCFGDSLAMEESHSKWQGWSRGGYRDGLPIKIHLLIL